MWPGVDLGEGRLEGSPRLGRGVNTAERAVQGRGEVGESREEQKRPQRGSAPWTRSKATRVLIWCPSSWAEAAADLGEAPAVRMGVASEGPGMVTRTGHPRISARSVGHRWVRPGSAGHPRIRAGSMGHPRVSAGSMGHPQVRAGSAGHPRVSARSTVAGREGGRMRAEWKTRKPTGQRWAGPGGHTRHKLRSPAKSRTSGNKNKVVSGRRPITGRRLVLALKLKQGKCSGQKPDLTMTIAPTCQHLCVPGTSHALPPTAPKASLEVHVETSCPQTHRKPV